MWFAIAHINPPAPIVRPVTPAVSGNANSGKANAATGSPAARSTVNGAVFEMPAGLPSFLKKLVMVPKSDEFSEFAALQSVAQQVGVPFTHTGPDFALIGTQVPFGKPVPSYEFLWYVGQSYIPGTVNVNGSGAIAVANRPVKK
jgi:hypothetical protein